MSAGTSLRARLESVFRASLTAVEPGAAVRRHVTGDAAGRLCIAGEPLARGARLAALAVGKAAAPMARALEQVAGERIAAGLAIALKDPLTNLVGWIFILWRRPFVVGDRIQIGQHAGDVIDQRIFQFTLLEIGNWVAADQSTGRVIHNPNGKVFTEALANYTTGFEYIWNEIPVRVTFESQWENAKDILQEIADRHAAHLSQEAADRIRLAARRFMIMYSKLTPIVYTRVEEDGVLLTVRYMCDPRKRRSSEHAIWEDVLRAFAEQPDIEFAYPTQRFYHRWVETQQGPDGHRDGSGVAAAGDNSDR